MTSPSPSGSAESSEALGPACRTPGPLGEAVDGVGSLSTGWFRRLWCVVFLTSVVIVAEGVMGVGEDEATREVARLVEGLFARVRALHGVDLAGCSVQEMAGLIEAGHSTVNSLQAFLHTMVAAFDATGGGRQLGYRNTSGLLQDRCRMTGAQAGSMVATARALRDELPATAASFAEGAISVLHVAIIRRGHNRLGESFQKSEASLVEFARSHDVRDTACKVDILIDEFDPRRPEDDPDPYRDRTLAVWATVGGWVRIDGLLDPACGEKVIAAMDVFAAPTGEDDTREPGQRRVDALAEIADRALALTDRASGSGAVTVMVNADQLQSGQGVTWPTLHAMTGADVAAHLCAASVSYVVGIPVDQIRWEPLAVGFADRWATAAQRRALAARDGGCVHPGCSVVPHRCVAHHIRHWRDGGPTDLSNLVLLCDYHHRQVHLEKFIIVLNDGFYTTTPAKRGPP